MCLLTNATLHPFQNEQSICASAPGKVILFGEHSVVYGQTAVSAALSDLRIFVLVTPTNNKSIRMVMPDLKEDLVDVSFPSSEIVLNSLQSPPTKLDVSRIQDKLKELNNTQPRGHKLDESTLSCLIPIVYLLNKVAPSLYVENGLDIWVRSQDLPVGAGLGSSAAFSVACAAALVRLSMWETTSTGKPEEKNLKLINEYAYHSEILLHGTPSGLDNSVSTYGGAIAFTREENGIVMDFLDNLPKLNMIITHTHVPRSTKKLVRKVREMYDKHNEVIHSIFDSMGAIARQFRDKLCTKSCSGTAEDFLSLVRINQHLLRSLGVSHPSLDHICQITDDIAGDKAATKLTGAGGGGCAITLVNENGDTTKSTSELIKKSLLNSSSLWNFQCFTSSVGGDGVQWLHPDQFPMGERKKKAKPPVTRYISVVAFGLLAAVTVAMTRKNLRH